MTEIEDFFDRAYRQHPRYWWRNEGRYSISPDDHPTSLLTQHALRWATDREPGRVLDVGAGEGADAIRMALLGWEVVAVELSQQAVEKIDKLAREAGAEVTVTKGDLNTLQVRGQFDLVICNGVLHYVEDKRAACRTLQSMTAPGGANLVSLWSSHTPVPECHQIIPTFPDAEEGDVRDSYRTWRKSLMYLERGRLEQSHDDMSPHVHSFIKMFAHNEPVKPIAGGRNDSAIEW
ncbi:class I SAM-dependent methyltransferase [Pedococcus bigeumensis]|uniref:Class I SAM-dependent methyltransferase n=1 Tax=Pedococcus bigeumensis TaxID=433644 RepID=A0A502CYD1_9MICO|nr:class I SAM-dependent methyltransferase [Pedococcus bigeumensis]TPG17169.1 class I SAM-dependent methyltransferase [Pedococcus bigeumensis]